ncbi:uncharacterized protein LOC100907436 [Galendromus occidentalis]|uniref:Uncharacterized protein LOC100907436 n=1 Tax=Galendromus occidentalis TaxID=34638 RepID=A0AAJ6QXA1_9ACAR|nr:uncharacterized protein LOC100907436 [Galendromus occidentalis]
MATGEGLDVLEVCAADAKRVAIVFRKLCNSRDDCNFTIQPVNSNKSFIKIFHRDAGARTAFAERILNFLREFNNLGSGKAEPNMSKDHTFHPYIDDSSMRVTREPIGSIYSPGLRRDDVPEKGGETKRVLNGGNSADVWSLSGSSEGDNLIRKEDNPNGVVATLLPGGETSIRSQAVSLGNVDPSSQSFGFSNHGKQTPRQSGEIPLQSEENSFQGSKSSNQGADTSIEEDCHAPGTGGTFAHEAETISIDGEALVRELGTSIFGERSALQEGETLPQEGPGSTQDEQTSSRERDPSFDEEDVSPQGADISPNEAETSLQEGESSPEECGDLTRERVLEGAAARSSPHVSEHSFTSDVFECAILKENIEEPEKPFKDIMLLRPYAAQFLHRENVTRGTALQNAVWPHLFAGKSMAIIGPRGYGKTFAYLPVALSMCLKNVAVVLTATDGRLAKLVTAVSYHHLSIEISRPPSKIRNASKQLLICSLCWFWRNRKDFTPSVVIFDRLDRMVESSLDVTCLELADSLSNVPLIATARRVTTQVEQTLELMNITSSAMVPCERIPRRCQEYLVSIDDVPDRVRYSALLSTLRQESRDAVILIFFHDEAETNSMYDKLDDEAHRGTLPFSSFNNLQEKLEDEQMMLRTHLNDGIPGVYLACLQDHRWLYTTNSVHTVINYRPPDCAQAYRYRRERLRLDGKVLTITRGVDLNHFPEELFHIMSGLTGYDAVTPCVENLRVAFEKESELRNRLRFVLLS